MRKFFWESIEQKLRGVEGKPLSAKQIMEVMNCKWGKKEEMEEACSSIKEMVSIYEGDAYAKKFMENLNEAICKICGKMMDEAYDVKKDDITIIASSKEEEGEVVDEKKEEKEDDKEEEEDDQVDEKKEVEDSSTDDEEEEELDEKKEELIDTNAEEKKDDKKEVEEDSHLVRMKELAKARKERMAKLEEKKEPEEEKEEPKEKEEEVDETLDFSKAVVTDFNKAYEDAKKNGFTGTKKEWLKKITDIMKTVKEEKVEDKKEPEEKEEKKEKIEEKKEPEEKEEPKKEKEEKDVDNVQESIIKNAIHLVV